VVGSAKPSEIKSSTPGMPLNFWNPLDNGSDNGANDKSGDDDNQGSNNNRAGDYSDYDGAGGYDGAGDYEDE
jgi:hypothetical protein